MEASVVLFAVGSAILALMIPLLLTPRGDWISIDILVLIALIAALVTSMVWLAFRRSTVRQPARVRLMLPLTSLTIFVIGVASAILSAHQRRAGDHRSADDRSRVAENCRQRSCNSLVDTRIGVAAGPRPLHIAASDARTVYRSDRPRAAAVCVGQAPAGCSRRRPCRVKPAAEADQGLVGRSGETHE